MHPLLLIFIFFIAALVGYKLLSNVPGLLHTPLMSGMNALCGVTILGALVAAGAAMATGLKALGYAAIVLAMITAAGGFGVTGRMLGMFKRKENEK